VVVLCNYQQYFSYIVALSFIGGAIWSTQIVVVTDIFFIYVRLRSTSSLWSTSNPCPISTSQTSIPQIHVLISNFQIYGHFSLSQIDIQW